jgi:hypothetical protein
MLDMSCLELTVHSSRPFLVIDHHISIGDRNTNALRIIQLRALQTLCSDSKPTMLSGNLEVFQPSALLIRQAQAQVIPLGLWLV